MLVKFEYYIIKIERVMLIFHLSRRCEISIPQNFEILQSCSFEISGWIFACCYIATWGHKWPLLWFPRPPHGSHRIRYPMGGRVNKFFDPSCPLKSLPVGRLNSHFVFWRGCRVAGGGHLPLALLCRYSKTNLVKKIYCESFIFQI